jgi:NAD(P)-dependent dehydrogenase (short-subunit alcohol dehydrogenase family)
MDAPNLRLDGKAALITGAGRGIGVGIAHALASAGCAVAVQDIELDVARATAETISAETGARAVALGGDITDLSLPARAVRQVVEALGGLHILVNNAAIQQEKDWTQFTVEEITRQVNADFVSPILFCQQVAPIFRGQKFGRIINIGSIQQRVGNPDMLPYSMSKAAMENLTRGLARVLAPDGVTVNLLNPGYFNTYRNRDQFKTRQDLVERGKQYVPSGRIGEPEDCGGIALLLASEAGAYITGQTIFVDGGMSVRL